MTIRKATKLFLLRIKSHHALETIPLGMQAEQARLLRRQDDLARDRRAAEQEAAAAKEAANTARAELRRLTSDVEVAQTRLKALQECAPLR